MGQWDTHFKGVNPPVEQVSWDDIQEFETRTGFGLPTEAQWEYACRARTQTAFFFGFMGSDGPAGPCADWGCGTCPERDPFLWYCANSEDRTQEVGTRRPNAFGLHDVHGNVQEWCEDVYDAAFYSRPEAGGPDPVSTSGSGGRVHRGGGWLNMALDCRAACRDADFSGSRVSHIGFRPAVWPLP
jgi:formylglycine-generating enzyme required for sulfatase activity